MINKGKGKLKWERDMPRDIEEKLEVIIGHSDHGDGYRDGDCGDGGDYKR